MIVKAAAGNPNCANYSVPPAPVFANGNGTNGVSGSCPPPGNPNTKVIGYGFHESGTGWIKSDVYGQISPGVYGCIPAPTSWSYPIEHTFHRTCPMGTTMGQVNGEVRCTHVFNQVNYEKSAGNPCPKKGQCAAGNPINAGNGNKYQREVDYQGSGPFPLSVVRSFNSVRDVEWAWNVRHSLTISTLSTGQIVVRVTRGDGQVVVFWNNSGSFASEPDVVDKLVQLPAGAGWKLTTANDDVEIFNAAGQLQTVTNRAGLKHTYTYGAVGEILSVADDFGHAIQFTFDPVTGRTATMVDPAGGVTSYGYDASGRLNSVTFPDGASRTYLWNEAAYTGGASNPNLLTGITDEAGVRYATFAYRSDGKAISTQHAGGADLVSVVYNSPTSVTLTDALGAANTVGFSIQQSVPLMSSTGGFCRVCGFGANTASYNGNGVTSSRTDYNGIVTSFTYSTDGRLLELTRKEANGNALMRTITTTWHPTYRIPASIVEPNRRRDYTFDASGNILTDKVTETATSTFRTWTYTYDSYGRVLTADGPRTDVSDITTYAYHLCTTGAQCGQLYTVTNAAGQVTTYNTYNGHGQPLTITDPNGVVTTLAYDSRQRLTSRTVGSETTTFTYWPIGVLKRVTLPDGSYIENTYDAAHRLTQVADGLGNRIAYTLNAIGQRTAEQVYDPSNVLRRTHSRVFSNLGRMTQDIGAAGGANVTTTLGYDGNGNTTTINAPMTRNTTQTFDAHNRLKQITNPATGITQFAYDDNDNLTAVTDPRNLVTSYQYTGFGDLKQQTSPDTGVTTNTYDSGGNLLTSTDARSAITTYTYDSLNRVATAAYKIGATTDQTIAFTYDAGTNGKGRMTGASDANHSMAWVYGAQGRITSKSQNVGGINQSMGYSYSSGRLSTLTLPSGQVVTYSYNSNNQIAGITVGATTVLSSVQYDPFGPVKGWTWGNGTLMSRTYDQDGKLTQLDSAGLKTQGYDDAFRITSITDALVGANNWTYNYDSLDRLTGATKAVGTVRGWTYDANNNRLTETGSAPSSYTISATNNRVTSTTGALARTYGYDSAGNTLSYATVTSTYNNRGRLASLTKTGSTRSYVYNALGQMARAAGGTGGTVLYMYDEAGHVVGEYGAAGSLIQETIWLGDTPVATLRPNGAGVDVFYVHVDHLNTPRKITQPSDNATRWRWDSDPFGTELPDENPSALGAFAYNLRFPGQIYDPHAGLHQNYFRDYDSAIGRYVESDPVGLLGGPNTYLYTDANPIDSSDPTGEFGIGTAAAGAAFDLVMQLTANGGNWRCVDINSVLISAAWGAVAPGIRMASQAARQGQNARRALEVLEARRAAATTANRAARVGQSIDRNAQTVTNTNTTLIQQAAAQVGAWITKTVASPTPWTIGNDCECQK
jgi:RHS repeat-associated protein